MDMSPSMTPLDRWNAALDMEGLSPSEKLVLLEIANRDGGSGAFASVGKMAERLGLSRRQVQRCLRSLADKGCIVQRTRWRDKPNRYTFSSHPEVRHDDAPPASQWHTRASPRRTEQEENREAERDGSYDDEDLDSIYDW